LDGSAFGRGRGVLRRATQGKLRDGTCCLQNSHRAALGATHRAFFRRHQIVVAGEVQPAMDDVKRKFGAEVAAVFLRVGGGGVGRDADLAGDAVLRIALKRDHVGRGRILEKVVVQPG